MSGKKCDVRLEASMVLQTEVMNNFCLPFAERLLEKLKLLQGEDRIFMKDASLPQFWNLTPVARAVVLHLHYMLFRDQDDPILTRKFTDRSAARANVQELIDVAEEFISIFK